MERVLVVDVNARGSGTRYSTLDVIGVGPRLITSLMRLYNIDTALIPYECLISNPSIVDRYDTIALSFMVSDFDAVRKAISLWRRRRNGLVILGGPGTLDPRIEQLEYDIAIVGEAEIPLTSLLKLYSGFMHFLEAHRSDHIPSIPGIMTKGSPKSSRTLAPWAPRDVLNSVKTSIPDIRNYPFFWASRIYIEVVRGCSNFYRPRFTSSTKCTECNKCRKGPLAQRLTCPLNIPPGCGYCSVPLIHGPPRSRSPDIIEREVHELVELGASRIVLSAPDFLDYGRDLLVHPEPLTDPREPPPNIDYIEKLLYRLTSIDRVREGIVSLSIENVKPCLVNEYVAEVLGRYLKGAVVYIGLESASNELLERIGRPSTVEDAIQAINLLRKHGLRPYVYLMHGLPSETDSDIYRSAQLVDVLDELGVEHIVLYRFRPLPRTAFEGFEPPPPAIARDSTRTLYKRVREFNRSKKELLLGRILRVVVACKHPKKRGYLIAYPLHHGPVVLIRASSSFVGTIVDVRIVNVISDRVIEGKILYVRRRLKVNTNTLCRYTNS